MVRCQKMFIFGVTNRHVITPRTYPLDKGVVRSWKGGYYVTVGTKNLYAIARKKYTPRFSTRPLDFSLETGEDSMNVYESLEKYLEVVWKTNANFFRAKSFIIQLHFLLFELPLSTQ